MKEVIIFIILTLSFSFFAKGQVVEQHLAENRTTVIEKVPGSDDYAILDELNMGGFSLNEQVYIKDYSHKATKTEKLTESTKQLAVSTASQELNAEVNVQRPMRQLSSASGPALSTGNAVAADLTNANATEEIEAEDTAEMFEGKQVLEVRRGKVNYTPAPAVKDNKIATRSKSVKKAAPTAPAVAAEKTMTYRDMKMQEARAAAEYRKNKTDRNPVGEKVKRKGNRAPKWNADKRGKRSVFNCFKF